MRYKRSWFFSESRITFRNAVRFITAFRMHSGSLTWGKKPRGDCESHSRCQEGTVSDAPLITPAPPEKQKRIIRKIGSVRNYLLIERVRYALNPKRMAWRLSTHAHVYYGCLWRLILEGKWQQGWVANDTFTKARLWKRCRILFMYFTGNIRTECSKACTCEIETCLNWENRKIHRLDEMNIIKL